ncbi:MAG: hypothetical protein U0228_37830 [Myxococcaceae bacterium]
MPWKKTTFVRDVLFTEVWKAPLREVAARYGVSDVGLAKICGRLQVPRPPQGHWTRVALGQAVATPVLSPLPEGAPTTHVISSWEDDPLPPEYARRLTEAASALPARPPLVVGPELPTKLHPAAQQLRRHLASAEKDSLEYLFIRDASLVAARVTKATKKRALLIFDALLREFEARGMQCFFQGAPVRPTNIWERVESPKLRVVVLIEGDEYELVVKEPYRFEEAPQWAGLRLRRRKATGELQVLFEGPELHWATRDSASSLVETRLDGLFAKIPEARVRAANAKVRREWEAVLCARAERKRKAEERRRQEEEARLDLLEVQLTRWTRARTIQKFVEDMRARGVKENPQLQPFLEWCSRHAATMDPATTWEPPEETHRRKSDPWRP